MMPEKKDVRSMPKLSDLWLKEKNLASDRQRELGRTPKSGTGRRGRETTSKLENNT